uniref:Methyltransferase domain-containing protein n=1 Tax=viral metagenome TaxID=1070528 RepID=A0A6C0DRB7_9ZZZZ
MFSYLYRIFTASSGNMYLLKLVIILAILLVLLIQYRTQQEKNQTEGFSQKESYVLKQDENKYDDFYVELYDTIQKPEQRNVFEIMILLRQTMPTKKSNILDIGCGTGSLVNEMTKLGYRAYGIDKSQAMIDAAEKKHSDNDFKCTDIVDPMEFEPSTFTHILCTNFTIYEIDDKMKFFRHCFHWLAQGGYLFVHLVDPDKFDTITPIGKHKLDKNPQRISKKRITDTTVDFPKFEYKSSYDFGENPAIFKETFTDKKTKNIRQNEQRLYFVSVDGIIDIAKKNGFIVHSKADMEDCIDDSNQYLYIFERIQGNLPLL